MGDGSRRTVVVALVANAGIAGVKLVAAAVTGSSAMFAEAVHSVADTGNEVLLLVAQRRGGRDAYFWSLLAAIGVFVVGGALAIHQGFHELFDPSPVEAVGVAYAVLAVGFVLESISFARAVRHLQAEARRFDRELLTHVVRTSDPTVRAVFTEDAAAMVGTALAAGGIALHQATDSVVPDAVASILIGLVLGAVALFLGERNRDFLVGEEVSPAAKARIASYIEAYPGVVEVRELTVTFIGPDEVWVVARVDVEDGLTARGVEALVVDVERTLIQRSAAIARADIVPVGAAPPRARVEAGPGARPGARPGQR